MSATASAPKTTGHQVPPAGAGVRIVFSLAGSAILVALLVSALANRHEFRGLAVSIVVWIAVAALADSLTVPCWKGVVLTMSLPVTMAAAMVFPAPVAGFVAFFGAFDRRKVTLDRLLYNNGQVAASVMLASLAFHSLHGDPDNYPAVFLPAFVALVVDYATNTVLVMVPVGVIHRVSARDALRRVYGATWMHHVAGYLCLGLLALPLATVASVGGLWALPLFVAPLGIVREMFLQARRAAAASNSVQVKDLALKAASESLAEERRDERFVVAGELHDEVLPPLFKVHLMGQVLRRDLDSGRLLDLDQDLPELLAATEVAQDAIRSMMRDLRRSPLGPAGLEATVRLLGHHLEAQTSARIEVQSESIGASHLAQLLAYQVIREAMNNAVKYARATSILVKIRSDGEGVHLSVRDDGVGFDKDLVDQEAHFGLQLIAERVDAAGGHVLIDSVRGVGTSVIASIPDEIR